VVLPLRSAVNPAVLDVKFPICALLTRDFSYYLPPMVYFSFLRRA